MLKLIKSILVLISPLSLVRFLVRFLVRVLARFLATMSSNAKDDDRNFKGKRRITFNCGVPREGFIMETEASIDGKTGEKVWLILKRKDGLDEHVVIESGSPIHRVQIKVDENGGPVVVPSYFIQLNAQTYDAKSDAICYQWSPENVKVEVISSKTAFRVVGTHEKLTFEELLANPELGEVYPSVFEEDIISEEEIIPE